MKRPLCRAPAHKHNRNELRLESASSTMRYGNRPAAADIGDNRPKTGTHALGAFGVLWPVLEGFGAKTILPSLLQSHWRTQR
jgi:hypothetical protein